METVMAKNIVWVNESRVIILLLGRSSNLRPSPLFVISSQNIKHFFASFGKPGELKKLLNKA